MKLYLAAKKSDIKSIIDLLEQGAKINDKDYKGRTALHIAVSNSQLEAAPEQNFDDEDIEYDELYDTIVDWLTEQNTVSISMLQRKFRLGFYRAGCIIDRL